MSPRKVVAAAVLSLALTIGSPGVALADPADDTAGEPANVGDAKTAAIAYHDSGQYERELAEVAAQAINWIGTQAPAAPRAAVVFDIDETALSNWEVIKANDFGRFIDGPVQPARCMRLAGLGPDRAVDGDPADAGHLHHGQGSGRSHLLHHRPRRRAARGDGAQPAVNGLHRIHPADHGAGGCAVRVGGRLQGAAARRIEAEGYTIVANIGDQPSDLAGGHSEQTFLLPDPFYRIP